MSGTLHDGATDTGIGLEVRTGGPAIGFSPVASYMYTDSDITLGYANTEAQVTFFESAPLLSVVAPLEKNPQMVMWDPATYPDVNSLKDLGDAGITISVFGGGVFAEVFIAQGIWSADQLTHPMMVHLRTSSRMVEQSLSKVSHPLNHTTTRTYSPTGVSQ